MMANEIMKLDMIGLKELNATIAEIGTKGEVELKREVRTTTTMILNDTRRNIKKHFDSGELYNSYTADSNDGWETAEVGSSAKHAVFLELGTRSHIIKPKDAKFLRFFWEKVGGEVYAKQVRHPGTAAHPYLLQAYLTNVASFPARLKARLDKLGAK